MDLIRRSRVPRVLAGVRRLVCDFLRVGLSLPPGGRNPAKVTAVIQLVSGINTEGDSNDAQHANDACSFLIHGLDWLLV